MEPVVKVSGIYDDLMAQNVPVGLADVLVHIADGCQKISEGLRSHTVTSIKASNVFGDDVLSVDVMAEEAIEASLMACASVAAFVSEERPTRTPTGQSSGAFTVTFDPLDGSSVISTNFSVGSIFGVWPGAEVLGQRVRDQVASAAAVYGPRTVLFIAIPGSGVREYLLREALAGPEWCLVPLKAPILFKDRSTMFSPGNLRATRVLPWYAAIVSRYMREGATLRYTGGMVPDVCQMLVKGDGIFMTPESPTHKVKLRVLFETGPLAFLITCAGGAATDGQRDLLDVVVEVYGQKGAVALGCPWDVKEYQRCCTAAASKL